MSTLFEHFRNLMLQAKEHAAKLMDHAVNSLVERPVVLGDLRHARLGKFLGVFYAAEGDVITIGHTAKPSSATRVSANAELPPALFKDLLRSCTI